MGHSLVTTINHHATSLAMPPCLFQRNKKACRKLLAAQIKVEQYYCLTFILTWACWHGEILLAQSAAWSVSLLLSSLDFDGIELTLLLMSGGVSSAYLRAEMQRKDQTCLWFSVRHILTIKSTAQDLRLKNRGAILTHRLADSLSLQHWSDVSFWLQAQVGIS